jgi:hypothetical protein
VKQRIRLIAENAATICASVSAIFGSCNIMGPAAAFDAIGPSQISENLRCILRYVNQVPIHIGCNLNIVQIYKKFLTCGNFWAKKFLKNAFCQVGLTY